MRWHGFLALVLVLSAAGCGGGGIVRSEMPKPSLADDPSAADVSRSLERDLASLANLPASDRPAAEQAFGSRLENDLRICQGTRYENLPLYMLAQWTMVHGTTNAPTVALGLLDRLETLPAPAYRNAGRALRVKAMLRLGRTGEARDLANRLEAEVPEFHALAQVEFHALVGTTAPKLPGLVASGADPTTSFVLILFVGAPDTSVSSVLAPFKPAVAHGSLSLVVVTTAGDLLAAASAANTWGCQVRWVRPEDTVLGDAWRLPGVPASVLLGPGPERVVLAVDPGSDDVLRAAGVKP